jgi:nucleoid DNA-binding protein
MVRRKVDNRTATVPPWVQAAIVESGVTLSKKDAFLLFEKVWERMGIEFARTGKLTIRNFGTLKLKTYVNKDTRNRHRTRWVLSLHMRDLIRTYDDDLLNKESLEVRVTCVLCGVTIEDSSQINAICETCLGDL